VVLLTRISRSEIVDRELPSIEDEDHMHAQAIAVEFQALLRVFDAYHEMIETVVRSCWGAGARRRDDVFTHIIRPLWEVVVVGYHYELVLSLRVVETGEEDAMSWCNVLLPFVCCISYYI
jgi:hypothetical protein